MSAYDFWKTAHVLCAAIVFGTGLGIAFFCASAYRNAMRSGDIGALRSALRLALVAGLWLMAPAMAFEAVSGLSLMDRLGWPLSSPLATAVWWLFGFAGACWIPALCIQAYLARTARRVPSIQWLPPSFHAWFAGWIALGAAALAAVIAIYGLMIAKPLATA